MFVTSGLSGLLGLSDRKAAELYHNSALFDQYIRAITKTPVKGEDQIYQIGNDRYLHIFISESPDSLQGIITDVTKDILHKKQMQYENTHDPLTGLYKFDHFKQLSSETLSEMPCGKTAAMVMLDLDHFKSINDTYGHDTGDLYLQSFANVMHSMPAEHFLCARRSGDEFCMLIFDCEDRAHIIRHLDFFYETLHGCKVVLSEDQSTAISISASCGFSLADGAGSDIGTLLNHADEALYEVKRSTKGTYAEYTQQ